MAYGEVLNPKTDGRLARNRPPRMVPPRVPTGYKLPPDLLEVFAEEAARAGVTMTAVAEQGIRIWCRRQQRKRGVNPTV